jgi:cysteine-rich repeat protein
MCNTASGTCSSTFKSSGSPCSAGICDGKGGCGAAPRCGDGIKNQGALEECDDGNRVDNDDCTNACKESRCGDGIVATNGSQRPESCEVGKGVATKWTCSAQCQWQTIYAACGVDSQCTAPEFCRTGICTLPCTPLGGLGSGSNCPTPPSPLVAWCNYGVGVCQLTECKTNADCPSNFGCLSSTSDFSDVSFTTMCSNQ